jgi:hypothetical protein
MPVRRTSGDSSPFVTQIGVSRYWKFVGRWGIEVDGCLTTFLEGYIFDRASIPEIVPSWIVSKDDLGCAGPAWHDLMCKHKGAVPRDGGEKSRAILEPYRTFSRSDTNRIFREILISRGVPRWRAWVAYWGVQIGAPVW